VPLSAARDQLRASTETSSSACCSLFSDRARVHLIMTGGNKAWALTKSSDEYVAGRRDSKGDADAATTRKRVRLLGHSGEDNVDGRAAP
jgi:hypothetical protein